MKKLLLLLALAPSAFGALGEAYMRIPGTGFCPVTGATSANPVRITATGTCGIANGDLIMVDRIVGLWIANVHIVSAADTKDRVRKVSNISGTCTSSCSFDLLAEDDSNVNGVSGGTYVSGTGRVGKVSLRTLKVGPKIWLDGTGGTRLADVTSGGAFASGAILSAVTGKASTAVANQAWGYDHVGNFTGSWGVTSALHWLATGTTASRDRAIWSCLNDDQSIGTPATNGAANHGTSNSQLADYPTQYWGTANSQNCSIIMDELSGPEIDNLMDFWYSDEPWSRGGFDYSAASHTVVPWKHKDVPTVSSVHTVNVTAGSTTVSRNSTDFTFTGLGAVAGDIILLCEDGDVPGSYASPHKIATVSANSITLEGPARTNCTNMHFQIGKAWEPGDMGWAYHRNHDQVASLSGGHEAQSSHPIFGQDTGSLIGPMGNRGIDYLEGWMARSIASCEYSHKACLVLSRAYASLHDETLPAALQLWAGGSTQTGGSYHHTRVVTPVLYSLCLWPRNSFTTDPTWTAACDALMTNAIRWYLASVIPGTTSKIIWHSFGGHFSNEAFGGAAIPLAYISWVRDTSDALGRNAAWILNNRAGGGIQDSGFLNSGDTAWEIYMTYMPTLNALAAAPSWTVHQRNNLSSLCVAAFGAAQCATKWPQTRGQDIKTSWSQTGTAIEVNWSGGSCIDHCLPWQGPIKRAWVNGGKPIFTGDDNSEVGGDHEKRATMQVGSRTNWPMPASAAGQDAYGGVSTPWRTDNESGNFMFVRSDVAGLYKSGANITDGRRQFLYIDGGGRSLLFENHFATLSSPAIVKDYHHYNINGNGTAASTSVITASRASRTVRLQLPTTDETADSKFFFPLGTTTGAMDTQNNSDTDGSYGYTDFDGNPITGQNVTWRIHACSSTDGSNCASTGNFEVAGVHRLSANASNLGAVAVTTASNLRFAEVQTGLPTMVIFNKGSAVSSVSAFTINQADTWLVATGLAAGNYDVKLDGVTIGGCANLSVAAANSTLECPDVDAGSATIEAAGSPPAATPGSRISGGRIGGGARIQ